MTDELKHFYCDIDGVRMHWAQLGAASSRPPVLLLHGMMDSHLTWRKAATLLAADRRVIMPDLPGCGLSGRPDASYKLEWHAHVIARFIEHLELQTLDVVGHSFGGGVAQMLLLECPERMRRMVLVASGGLGRDVGFWLRFGTFPHFVEHYGQPFMAFGTRRALQHDGDEAHKQDVLALSVMNASAGTARAFSRTVRDVIDFRGQTRMFLQRAHEVDTLPPVAVLWGEQDRLIPIAHGHTFAERVQGAAFKSFPGAGHYVHQEQPQAFAVAVREFLNAPHAEPARLRAEPRQPRAAAPVTRRAWSALSSEVKALARRARHPLHGKPVA